MRVVLVSPGSRGDIQPFIALARGLRARGHDPLVVTNAEFEPLVRGYGVEIRPVAFSVREALGDERTKQAIEGAGVLRSFTRLASIARAATADLARVTLDAARGSDALVAGFGGLFIGHAVAEVTGLALIQAYNVPLTPTAAFAGALVPPLPGPRGISFPLSHRMTRQVLWATARVGANGARREILGLKSAPLLGPFSRGILATGTVLYGFSEHLIPRPAEWPANVEVTGSWYLDEPAGWTPPARLADFLAQEPAPVCIGFGSMAHRDPARTTAMAVEAVQRAGVRAVLVAGWGGLGSSALPPSVIAIDEAPHAWLFPRCAAVVHHGGAGTTAAGIRAGVPSVLVPFHGDQRFWGRRVAEIGIGPVPIPRRRLDAARLAAALRTVAGDEGMRRRAADLGARVRGEDGVARAVTAIERAAVRGR